MNLLLRSNLIRGADPAALQRHMGKPLLTALGKRLEVDLRAHFLNRNATPNKQGWPRSNFWSGIRNATLFTGATETVAEVTIAHPAFAQKLYGGTITPKESKYLALPARADAAGRSPFQFGDRLQFIPLKRGDLAGILVAKGDKTQEPYYFLMTKVEQDADANALPKQADLDRGFEEEADDFIARTAQREGLA